MCCYMRMHEDKDSLSGPRGDAGGITTGAFDAPEPAEFDIPLEVPDEYVDLAADVFALLSDPTRVRIILALCHGEHSVNQLADAVGRSQTAVSQHLAKLRWGHIVVTRQEGTRVFYRLVDEHARTLVQQAVFQAEHVVDQLPTHHRGEGSR